MYDHSLSLHVRRQKLEKVMVKNGPNWFWLLTLPDAMASLLYQGVLTDLCLGRAWAAGFRE